MTIFPCQWQSEQHVTIQVVIFEDLNFPIFLNKKMLNTICPFVDDLGPFWKFITSKCFLEWYLQAPLRLFGWMSFHNCYAFLKLFSHFDLLSDCSLRSSPLCFSSLLAKFYEEGRLNLDFPIHLLWWVCLSGLVFWFVVRGQWQLPMGLESGICPWYREPCVRGSVGLTL